MTLLVLLAFVILFVSMVHLIRGSVPGTTPVLWILVLLVALLLLLGHDSAAVELAGNRWA